MPVAEGNGSPPRLPATAGFSSMRRRSATLTGWAIAAAFALRLPWLRGGGGLWCRLNRCQMNGRRLHRCLPLRLRRSKSRLAAEVFAAQPAFLPLLRKCLAARGRVGMELSTAAPAFLHMAGDAFGGAMPAASGVIESPFAAKHDQRHRHAAFDEGRLTVVFAIARIAGIRVVRRLAINRLAINRLVIGSGRIAWLGVPVTAILRCHITAAQCRQQRCQPKTTAHPQRLHSLSS